VVRLDIIKIMYEEKSDVFHCIIIQQQKIYIMYMKMNNRIPKPIKMLMVEQIF